MILGGYNYLGFVRLCDEYCDEGGGGCLHMIKKQAFDVACKCDIAVESAYPRGPHDFQQSCAERHGHEAAVLREFLDERPQAFLPVLSRALPQSVAV
jgi:hypothetical protein